MVNITNIAVYLWYWYCVQGNVKIDFNVWLPL